MSHVDGEDDGVGYGVFGHSPSGQGVRGSTGNAVVDTDVNDVGVYGISKSNPGVHGDSNSSDGVFGHSKTGIGVSGRSDARFGTGVYGTVGSDTHPDSEDSISVFGDAFLKGTGVRGKSLDGTGVIGDSDTGIGVRGLSDTNAGIHGINYTGGGVGVRAWGFGGGTAVAALSSGSAGLWLGNINAGDFYGAVDINGNLKVTGTKSFKIDHPLDPSNKYLYHSSVESPDMKNVYDGVVVLDAKGEAVVVLAAWFEALNKEFRYQLTPIGAPGPNLHIAKEIENRRFKIAGGSSRMKVCWQVTGIRQDAWAQANRLVVEQDKLANERGYYLHPEAHGYPPQKSIVEARYPKELSQFREEQQKITKVGHT